MVRDSADSPPGWLADLDLASAEMFDVRPVIAAGGDPRASVLMLADRVPPGGALVLVAPFNPLPLRRLLAERGFDDFAEPTDDGNWRVVFHRGASARGASAEKPPLPEDAPACPCWIAADGLHLDVRGMTPPDPMVTILKTLEKNPGARTVIVHHDRDPVYLYPELTERGWTARTIAAPADEIRLEITRKEP
jgi:uncharacterized protein (DUF2249 family)